MTDFEFDAKEKKALARNAKYKKNGSKSHKCTFPSDHLTPAQKRKLNGPTTTVYMGKPMTWAEFKPLSDTLKIAYITYLTETYGATGADLAKMFNVVPSVVSKEKKRLGLRTGWSSHSTPEHLAMWDAFCNGVVGGQPQEPVAESEAPVEVTPTLLERMDVPQDCTCLDSAEEPETQETTAEYKPVCGVTKLEVSFNCLPTLGQLETLYQMLGSTRARVKIEMEVI